MKLLDGKAVSGRIKERLASAVRTLLKEGGRAPHLAAILVGHDGASETYVGSKIRSCEKIGFKSTLIRLEDDVTEAKLLEKIRIVNEDPGIDGLIVQLPLPDHIDATRVSEAVEPAKDVDGFHSINTGRLAQGRPCFVPATPQGIMMLLEDYKVETEGQHCVIIGRSQIVGMPLSLLLSRNAYPGNCTVTLCHSRTRELGSVCSQADILVAALGKPGFVQASMVREGATVIDVGITRVPDPGTKKGYRISGDVNFEDVASRCEYITPVPGGVGPMTIAGLLSNTLIAARKEIRF